MWNIYAENVAISSRKVDVLLVIVRFKLGGKSFRGAASIETIGIGNMFAILGVAIALFISTNIDDIFVLVGFFADPRFRMREVLIGQHIGMAALVGVSVVASLSSAFIPHPYVGLLALIPIAVGTKNLCDLLWRGSNTQKDSTLELSGKGHKQVVTVALITIANGGDNVGIYTPAFAIHSKGEVGAIVIIFAIMTGIWCLLAFWIVNHPLLGAPIRRYGRIVASAVLIALGVMIIVQAGTLNLLRHFI